MKSIDEEEITVEIVLCGELFFAFTDVAVINWRVNAAPFCC